ncbi:MAG: hypothetical protein GY909_15260 [Oligoflexia bacterium]|nr:hypothetical protein [Oligoflexia bacterium]
MNSQRVIKYYQKNTTKFEGIDRVGSRLMHRKAFHKKRKLTINIDSYIEHYFHFCYLRCLDNRKELIKRLNKGEIILETYNAELYNLATKYSPVNFSESSLELLCSYFYYCSFFEKRVLAEKMLHEFEASIEKRFIKIMKFYWEKMSELGLFLLDTYPKDLVRVDLVGRNVARINLIDIDVNLYVSSRYLNISDAQPITFKELDVYEQFLLKVTKKIARK